MDFERLDRLPEFGFDGGMSIAELQSSCCKNVPVERGVYLVVRNSEHPIKFCQVSSGGHYKGRDPSVSVSELEAHWVEGAKILYIGKAGGSSTRTTLHNRLLTYVRFGNGRGCAHWGGRFIWQLDGAEKLLLYWRPTLAQEPRHVEKNLLSEFSLVYRQLPFANLQR